MLNILAWIVLGLIAGVIAKWIYPGRQGGGLFATTFLGIIGAFVGGSILTLIQTGKFALTATNAISIPAIFVAVLGAMFFIFIWGLLTRSAGNA